MERYNQKEPGPPAKTLKPVYYMYGSEDFLAEEALNEIRRGALKGGFESMNYHVYEGKTAQPAEVIAVASTFPAFSDKRVVVIRGAESIKNAQESEYLEYVKNPSPATCLVFVSSSPKVDRGSPFFKYLNEKGYLSAFNRLDEKGLLLWVKKEIKRQGKEITESSARKLIATAGDRLREVKGEMDKIVIFTGEKPVVEDSDVEEAGLDCREETIFDLSDAIGVKDVKKALRILSKISDEEPLKVLSAISRQIRILLKLKAILRKGVAGARAAGAVGVPPFYLEGYIKRSRCFSERELKKAIFLLSAADIDFKTGRKPQELILSKLIIDLCKAA